MKQYLIFGLACSFILNFTLLAQDRPGGHKISNDKIIQEVSRLLRWSWFWEALPLQNYVQGKRMEMAVVESPSEVATFLADIGISVRFDFNGQSIDRAHIQGLSNTTNSSWVDKYVNEYGRTSDFEVRPRNGGYEAGPVRSHDTLTMEQKRNILQIRSLSFTLPKLDPPDYILLRRKPAELPRLESAVPAGLNAWYNPSCGEGEISIPFFSADDPRVDVYADLGTCGKGIFFFTHDENGQWESSPFWPDKPPNDFSSIIQKIRTNVADTVRLPVKLK